MRILVDADGCPVVDSTIALARAHQIECLLLCDTSHVFEKDGARTLTFSKGADSVDFALVNLLQPGDIVVTQDYGLAAMCLARNAVVLNQDGMEYTADNINALLLQRHTARKIRNGGGRLKGPPKRKPEQNDAFRAKLEELLSR
ncbi:MAG: YaiI/YqxD family protein [Clostridiales bacterium]|nr:YaiI/YqxD family protein [Clostridiales bacterium]